MSLSPCRRCGTSLVECVYRKGPTVNRGVTRLGWMVACPTCGYSTHARANPRTACEEWNKMGKAADTIPKTPGATCRTMY